MCKLVSRTESSLWMGKVKLKSHTQSDRSSTWLSPPPAGWGLDQSCPPWTTTADCWHPQHARPGNRDSPGWTPSFRLEGDSGIIGGARRTGVPEKSGESLATQAHRRLRRLYPSARDHLPARSRPGWRADGRGRPRAAEARARTSPSFGLSSP